MQVESQPYFREKLRETFCEKQRKNSSFSLRAYAKYLGIHSATLSSTLKGKRALPLAIAEKISDRLELSPIEKGRFISSIYEVRSLKQLVSISLKPLKETALLEETYYKIISEWEHYAILSLLECNDCKSDVEWISKRLSISELRVEEALKKLKETKLIVISKKGKIRKNFQKLKTSEDIYSRAIQKSHKESLEIASQKIQLISPEKRDYSTVTMAINPNRLEESKSLIREFRKRLARLMEDGRKTEVYRLSIQLYPLTKLKEGEKV